MNQTIEQMLKNYNIKNEQDEINALKEIIQEIVLCGLSRGKFFDKVAFYGGTALRIFYGLNRFSEDLDFSLLKPDKDFDLAKYFSFVEKEVKAYGLNLSISEKVKSKESNIVSAFLKGDTKEHILMFFPNESTNIYNHLFKNIKIKFEVDINPPAGATYEYKYKLLPSPHEIRLYDESSLFSGKIHAILCRNWNKRTKGRDLYDYVYFLANNTPVNMELIKNKLLSSNYIDNDNFSLENLKDLLNEKFKNINYKEAKEDVIPFISDPSSLELWSAEFFIEITKKLYKKDAE